MRDIVLGRTITQCKDEVRDMANNIDYADKEGLLTACFVFLEEYEKIILGRRYNVQFPESIKVKATEYENHYNAEWVGDKSIKY